MALAAVFIFTLNLQSINVMSVLVSDKKDIFKIALI